MSKYRIPSDYRNDVPRSNHNFDADSYGTIHPGMIIPVHHRHLNVGDRVRGTPAVLIQSQAMLGPLLQGFKYVTIATFMPDSVLYGWMDHGIPDSVDGYLDHNYWYFNAVSASKIPYSSYTPPVTPGIPESWPRLQVGVTDYKNWIRDDWSDDSLAFDHIGRGSLWDWLGVPAGAVLPKLSGAFADGGRAWRWNVAPAVAYFLSCYYYFRNPQEKYMYATRDAYTLGKNVADGANVDLTFDQLFQPFDPKDLIGFIAAMNFNKIQGLVDSENRNDIMGSYPGYSLPSQGQGAFCSWLSHAMGAHGGFFSAPYSPDLFGNIVEAGSSPTAYVDLEDGGLNPGDDKFAVTRLREKSKIQSVMDRLFASGGMLSDIYRTLFGKNSKVEINKPEFLGVWQSGIDPTNVVASASGSADGEDVSAGQMVARIDRFSSFKGTSGIDYTAKQPGTLMFLSVLVPQPAYSQGLHPDLLSGSFADRFNPELNGLGFQAVPRHRYSMMPSDFNPTSPWVKDGDAAATDPNQLSVGDEVAWSWDRTDYSRLHGEFATNGYYQYWTLARRFTDIFMMRDQAGEHPVPYNYYGTYVHPLAWQYLFAGTGFMQPNFVLLAKFDLTVTNSVSKNYMPYLGR